MIVRLKQQPHKYNAIRCEEDGIKFPSKSEKKRYLELKLLQGKGIVKFFLMQVPFHLPAGVIYRLDFLVFWEDGNITFEDVKGFKTAVYKMKKKQVETLYKIRITEI